MNMFDALSRPFPGDAVHWRAQTLKGDGTSAMALAYIDARDVMRRLDEVCGPENWQDSYTETGKGRLICTISIRCGDDWICKSDGAGDTDVEGEKGAISDAFKRCAVKWGVGRYLYDMDPVWAECESYEKNGKKYWRKWTPRGLAQLKGSAGNAVAPVQPWQPQTDDLPPDTVTAFLDELRTAMRDGTAATYWEANYPKIPKNWRAYVERQKEALKQKKAA